VGALVLTAGSVVACGGDDELVDVAKPTAGEKSKAGPDQMTGVNEDGVPIGPDGLPLKPQLHGTYELANKFDLTTTGILPEVVNTTLKALSDFREKPSSTLVQLLDAANIPVVDTVINVIPAGIRDFFLGYVDDFVFTALYEKVPVAKHITGMLDDLASIMTEFELVTTLELPEGDAIGDARAKHTIRGVAYDWSEKRHVVSAPELVANLAAQPADTNMAALEKLHPEIETARLSIKDHTFKVPIGSFAVYAADLLAKDKFGKADLRDAIGSFVNCPALSQTVASRCISVGSAKVCVGHATEIENMCTLGLDVLVGVLIGQIKDLDIPFLQLKDGTAKMWDAPAPGQPLDAIVSRIDTGHWTASVKVGGEDKPVLATFTGRRL
jgi:hypothetical protein